MKKLVLVFLMFTAANSHAEVYRWTDANGKVHFGDKKPKAAAEDITDKVKQTNVDTSTSEHQKLETIFRKENEADREYQQQQSQPNLELLHRCAEARKYLDTINGRVQFIDANGKEVKVTEAERRQKVIAIQNEIKENCQN